jgi:hypothetical protein
LAPISFFGQEMDDKAGRDHLKMVETVCAASAVSIRATAICFNHPSRMVLAYERKLRWLECPHIQIFRISIHIQRKQDET